MATKKIIKKKDVIIYQTKNGAIELRGDFKRETIWATLDQIAQVFGRDKSVISRHFKNIYKDGELDEKATVAKNATVQMEGGRQIKRVVEYYNLDAYDRDALPKGKLTKNKVELTADKIVKSLDELKTELLRKSEATDIFGLERSEGAVSGIIGNVMQSFGDKELYETADCLQQP